jgi:ABC-type Fe3+-hydroxamate transport system substrate-binding protein
MAFPNFLADLVKFCSILMLLLVGACAESEPSAPGDGVRLAVLSPALADTLRALGHERLIVGKQRFDRFTTDDVPVVGDLTGIDYERLILTNPTHIVAQRTEAGLPERLVAIASDRGWEIVEIPLLSLDDTIASVRALDELAGGDGVAAAELEGRFAEALGGSLPLGRTVVLASASPLALIGPGAFHWEAVARLGGDALPEDGPAYLSMDAEGLLAMDPRTIIVLAPDLAADASLRDTLGAAGSVGLAAVEEGRVIVIRSAKCMLPSTAMIDFIEQVRSEAAGFEPADAR